MLTRLFTIAGRMVLAAALSLLIVTTSVSHVQAGTVKVLKEVTTLDYTLGGTVPGGNFGSFIQFLGLSSSDVVVSRVDDASMSTNLAARNTNFGSGNTFGSSGLYALLKFDLSVLDGFVGSTVNAAVLRLYQPSGNGAPFPGPVITDDYDEDTVTRGSPAGNVVPVVGTQGEWGPSSDSVFETNFDFFPTPLSPISSAPGANYVTLNMTFEVGQWASGSDNYGWGWAPTNSSYISSENLSATYLFGGAAPALFIDYTKVPEPSTVVLFAMMGIAAFCLTRSRKRKSLR